MLCEAVCGLRMEIEDGHIMSIRGDKDDPFSRGHICPKAAALKDVVEDPDRIREPLRRAGNGWQAISWDDAIAETAEKLAGIQTRYGRDAVGLYVGNPTAHSYSALLAGVLFARILGTRSRFSATSTDQLPHMLAALEMFGHQLLLPVPDIDRTQFFLVLGANPMVSNGSLMTAPGIAGRLRALRERGGKLVVVDPRRTETAAIADVHLAIRPGGDAAFLLAILHTLFAEKLADLGRLSAFTDGLAPLSAIAKRFSPERVAAHTGITAEAIRATARDFSRAPAAICYGRVGTCTQPFGGLTAWLINAINIVTGNLDSDGGAQFATPAVDLARLPAAIAEPGHFNLWQSRVRGLPEFGGELPAAALAEEIDTPGEGQIRALITFAGNPVLSTPDGKRLDGALANLDFMVSVDLYRNETTRHADLILPTSFGPERDHYDVALYLLAVRNAARYVKACVPPPPGVRHDWEVLLDLALALRKHGGGRRDGSAMWAARAMRRLGPRWILDKLMRLGPHGFGLRRRGLSVRALLRGVHGVDLGPLSSRLPGLLGTANRRIDLCPEIYASDVARLENQLVADRDPSELLLIGRRQLRSNNSWMHNSTRLVKGRDRCTLLIHPDDAAARGIDAGDTVRLRSATGEVAITAEVTDAIVRGVVSLPHGWGHHRHGATLTVAAAHPGASINDVIGGHHIDPLSGTASLNGIPVDVIPAAAKPPS